MLTTDELVIVTLLSCDNISLTFVLNILNDGVTELTFDVKILLFIFELFIKTPEYVF